MNNKHTMYGCQNTEKSEFTICKLYLNNLLLNKIFKRKEKSQRVRGIMCLYVRTWSS